MKVTGPKQVPYRNSGLPSACRERLALFPRTLWIASSPESGCDPLTESGLSSRESLDHQPDGATRSGNTIGLGRFQHMLMVLPCRNHSTRETMDLLGVNRHSGQRSRQRQPAEVFYESRVIRPESANASSAWLRCKSPEKAILNHSGLVHPYQGSPCSRAHFRWPIEDSANRQIFEGEATL